MLAVKSGSWKTARVTARTPSVLGEAISDEER